MVGKSLVGRKWASRHSECRTWEDNGKNKGSFVGQSSGVIIIKGSRYVTGWRKRTRQTFLAQPLAGSFLGECGVKEGHTSLDNGWSVVDGEWEGLGDITRVLMRKWKL